MAAALFPVPGTYLRPVGWMYWYCYEVVRILPADDEGPDHWTVRGWGLDASKQPYRDAGPCGDSAVHYLTDLHRVAPGVWKDPHEFGGPRYYRQIDVGGQKELFS